jgi:hypothetical protein
MSTPNPWFDGLNGPKVQRVIEERGDRLKEYYGTDDVYFALWMHAVSARVMRLVHVGALDLEDWAYRDNYDAGMLPVDAAVQMLEDNGYAEVLS